MIPLDDGGSRRPFVRSRRPAPDLSGVVEHVHLLEDRAGRRARLRIVPDIAPHLLYQVHEDGDGRVRVVGLRTRHVDIDVAGRRATVALQLRPWALALLGMDAGALRDRGVDAADAGLPDMAAWNQRLADALCQEARACILEDVVRRARRRSTARSRVREPVRRLPEAPGAGVREVSELTGVPSRTLRARFRRELGMGPKHFERISRLLRCLGLALRSGDPDWIDLASRTGYCDQSHLINDWQLLLGESPGRFLARGSGA